MIINNGTVAAQGTCAEIENAAAGKVYEIEDSRLGELSEPYFIQRQFERDSKRMTAVLSAQAQPTAASVSPRVEDGYICITKTYERGFYGCASVAEKCGCGEVCSARALRCSLSDTALLHAFQRHRARDDRGLSAADVAGDISVLLRVGCHFVLREYNESEGNEVLFVNKRVSAGTICAVIFCAMLLNISIMMAASCLLIRFRF